MTRYVHTATDPDIIAKGVVSGSVILEDVELVTRPSQLCRATNACATSHSLGARAGAEFLRRAGPPGGHRGVGAREENCCRGKPHILILLVSSGLTALGATHKIDGTEQPPLDPDPKSCTQYFARQSSLRHHREMADFALCCSLNRADP